MTPGSSGSKHAGGFEGSGAWASENPVNGMAIML
jgi:hypothetical protein